MADGNQIDPKDDELHQFIQENTGKPFEKNGLDMKNIIFQTKIENNVNKLRILSVGDRQTGKPTKSLLLVGETGAGKTALISSLVNIYMGIKYEDKFRLVIRDKESEIKNKNQTESQTESITVYEFSHVSKMKYNYNLTIIDTPGLNDTRGLDHDQIFFKNLEVLLIDEKFAVDEIHGIGFVVKSSANRLTLGQKYVYDGCMRLFGNDVKNKIHIMATFSDFNSDPQIIVGLEQMGVKYVELHEFSNSSIDLNNNEPTPKKARRIELAWKAMEESCADFLNYLSTSSGQSLTRSQETLAARQRLHEKLENLNPTFIENLSKCVAGTNEAIVKHKDGYTEWNKSYNCTKCHVTCHKPCYNGTLFKCKICKTISREGKKCTVCKCPPKDHAREDFHYDGNYLLEDNNEQNTLKVIKSLTEIRLVMEQLDDIALKPNPSSFKDYITSIIGDDKDGSKMQTLMNLNKQEIREQIFIKHPDAIEEICKQLNRELNITTEIGSTSLEICSIM